MQQAERAARGEVLEPAGENKLAQRQALAQRPVLAQRQALGLRLSLDARLKSRWRSSLVSILIVGGCLGGCVSG